MDSSDLSSPPPPSQSFEDLKASIAEGTSNLFIRDEPSVRIIPDLEISLSRNASSLRSFLQSYSIVDVVGDYCKNLGDLAIQEDAIYQNIISAVEQQQLEHHLELDLSVLSSELRSDFNQDASIKNGVVTANSKFYELFAAFDVQLKNISKLRESGKMSASVIVPQSELKKRNRRSKKVIHGDDASTGTSVTKPPRKKWFELNWKSKPGPKGLKSKEETVASEDTGTDLVLPPVVYDKDGKVVLANGVLDSENHATTYPSMDYPHSNIDNTYDASKDPVAVINRIRMLLVKSGVHAPDENLMMAITRNQSTAADPLDIANYIAPMAIDCAPSISELADECMKNFNGHIESTNSHLRLLQTSSYDIFVNRLQLMLSSAGITRINSGTEADDNQRYQLPNGDSASFDLTFLENALQIINPFQSNGNDAREYDWLVSFPRVVERLSAAAEDPVSLQGSDSVYVYSTSHPFIHAMSLYYGKIGLRDALCDAFGNSLKEISLEKVLSTESPFTNDSSFLTSISGSSSLLKFDGSSNSESWPQPCLDRAQKLISSSPPFTSSVRIAADRLNLGHNFICVVKGHLEIRNDETCFRASMVCSAIQQAISQSSETVAGGPVLLVTKLSDLPAWEVTIAARFGPTVQIIPYYGSKEDRNAIRSYMSNENMQNSDRKLYVVITHYESLLLDLHELSATVWRVAVLDEPFGLISRPQKYSQAIAALEHLSCRSRIISCSSLESSKGYLTDVFASLNIVLPPSMKVFSSDMPQSLSGPLMKEIRCLLSMFTIVYDSHLNSMSSTQSSVSVTDMHAMLPWMEWHNIHLSGSPNQDVEIKRLTYTNDFIDIDMDLELKYVVMNAVGKSAFIHRRSMLEPDVTLSKNAAESTQVAGKGRARGRGRSGNTVTFDEKLVAAAGMGRGKGRRSGRGKTGNSSALQQDETISFSMKSGNTSEGLVVADDFDSHLQMSDVAEADSNIMMDDVNDNFEMNADLGDDFDGAGVDGIEDVGADMENDGSAGQASDSSSDDENDDEDKDEVRAKQTKLDKENEANSPEAAKELRRQQAEQLCLQCLDDDQNSDFKRGYYIVQKGDSWSAGITAPGPVGFHRYLGIFVNKIDAAMAVLEAKDQRDVDLGVIVVNGQASGESTPAKLIRARRRIGGIDKSWEAKISGFKRKCRTKAATAADVNELIELLDDEDIVEEINSSFAPQKMSGQSLLSWSLSGILNTPALALLLGSGGEVIPITCSRAVLGRSISSHSLDLYKGMTLSKNSYYSDERLPLQGALLDISDDGEVIHIGDDSSIAYRHAVIKWNDTVMSFEVSAAHDVGIFVDQVKVLPTDGSVPLHPRSRVQIGSSIFYFVPSTYVHKGPNSPLRSRLNVAQALLLLLQYRDSLPPSAGTVVGEDNKTPTYADVVAMQEIALSRSKSNALEDRAGEANSDDEVDKNPPKKMKKSVSKSLLKDTDMPLSNVLVEADGHGYVENVLENVLENVTFTSNAAADGLTDPNIYGKLLRLDGVSDNNASALDVGVVGIFAPAEVKLKSKPRKKPSKKATLEDPSMNIAVADNSMAVDAIASVEEMPGVTLVSEQPNESNTPKPKKKYSKKEKTLVPLVATGTDLDPNCDMGAVGDSGGLVFTNPNPGVETINPEVKPKKKYVKKVKAVPASGEMITSSDTTIVPLLEEVKITIEEKSDSPEAGTLVIAGGYDTQSIPPTPSLNELMAIEKQLFPNEGLEGLLHLANLAGDIPIETIKNSGEPVLGNDVSSSDDPNQNQKRKLSDDQLIFEDNETFLDMSDQESCSKRAKISPDLE